ncbi:4-hydroxy-tetrahydrodipicolinate synthase [Eubacteriales bacterium mix99]|jgi:4-hydroxy-tetrahydrodipicolinate synthase
MSLFTGSCVAMATPFSQEGINLEALGKTIAFQMEQGTDALLVCGTTGEPATMSREEKASVIRYTVEKTAKRLPVLAGVGGNHTAEVVRASMEAEKLGADAVLAVTPYYNKTNARGLIAHYREINDAVHIPIIIYNVPGRTGMNVSPTALKELSRLPHIIGIKEASGDIAQVLEMRRLCGESIDIYSGNDNMVVPLLAAGGKGVVSVVANVAPRDTHQMVAEFLAGHVKESLDLQLKLLPLIDALFCEVNPIPVKTAINLMGFDMGPLRLPLADMAENHLSLLKQQMHEYGLM